MKRRRVDFKKRVHNQPKKRNSWFGNVDIFKYLSFLLIFLFILSTPLIIKKMIKINKIECTSQFGECSEELNSKLQLANNRDYYIAKNYIENELKKDISVENYLIQYKIPSTIKIDVTLKKPKYAIKYLDSYFLVDKNGLVLSRSNTSTLPSFVGDKTLNTGEYVVDSYKFALKILEKTTFLYDIQSAEIFDSEFKITRKDNIVLRFPVEGDVDFLIGSLRLIFSRLNEGAQGIKMEDVHEVDLRFQSPILR